MVPQQGGRRYTARPPHHPPCRLTSYHTDKKCWGGTTSVFSRLGQPPGLAARSCPHTQGATPQRRSGMPGPEKAYIPGLSSTGGHHAVFHLLQPSWGSCPSDPNLQPSREPRRQTPGSWGLWSSMGVAVGRPLHHLSVCEHKK